MRFGEVLFGGSRFVFWTIAPAVALALVVVNTMPMVEWTPARAAIMAGIDVTGLSFVIALYDPVRFRWAGRLVCAEVFLAYLAYLVHEWVFSEHPFRLAEARSDASPRNALLGFFIIGVPSLMYALTGAFAPPRADDELLDDGDDEST